jgi:hypothetical protein
MKNSIRSVFLYVRTKHKEHRRKKNGLVCTSEILQSSIPVNCYYVVDLLMACLELFPLL